MNNNATPENASASPLIPPKIDEEENDCISRLRESRNLDIPEEKELLRQLDQIRYNPRYNSVRKVLKYAGQAWKNEVDDPL